MIGPHDISGVLALPPTPVLIDRPPLGSASTVDIAEAVRAVQQLARDGVGSIGLCGTTGECAALTWGERRELYAAVVDAIGGRAPVFAGTTALGTREVVAQMTELLEIGVDAAFVGLPMWQTPTLVNAVGFYADLSAAVPELPVVIYGNQFFFKFSYPAEFWRGIVRQAPTAIACKVGFPVDDEIRTIADGHVHLLHGETMLLDAWERWPGRITAGWATSAAMGPEPWVAFFRALAAGDHRTCETVAADIRAVPSPLVDRSQFASYNVQIEKARIDAAGYMRCGPSRPPYTDLPADWRQAAHANAAAWGAMRARYADVAASSPIGGHG